MSGRIEVNRALAPVAISARVLNALCEHARETYPEECCGLLVGSAAGAFEQVSRCRNEMSRMHRRDPQTYPRDGKEAFHVNEADLQRAVEEAEAKGLRVTGVYHSHTNGGSYFSEMDQAFVGRVGFPFPEAQHIVISVLDGVVRESAVFRRIDEAPGFEGALLSGVVT